MIYGRPYNPRGRGKLERFHGILTQELVGRVHFRSLSHFRRELYQWRRRYNRARIHGGIGWATPYEVYHDPKLKSQQRVRSRRGRQDLLTVQPATCPDILQLLREVDVAGWDLPHGTGDREFPPRLYRPVPDPTFESSDVGVSPSDPKGPTLADADRR